MHTGTQNLITAVGDADIVMSWPDIGTEYALSSYIGSGQMADVYVAKHLPSRCQVAVKVLRPELSKDKNAKARFRREVETVARLDSKHTIRFFDFGETAAGNMFIVMELMRGVDLRTHMKHHGPASAEDALVIITQIARSLSDAHTAGVIHRDLKPENVQFVRDGSVDLKVLDFGLAKLIDPQVKGKLTGKMVTVGTPAYLAPEAAVAGRRVDWRADLYSLAVLAFELLTGRLPFTEKRPMEMMIAHVTQPIPSALELRPDLPRSVDVFFRAALAKDPTRRIASAELFVRAFADALQPH